MAPSPGARLSGGIPVRITHPVPVHRVVLPLQRGTPSPVARHGGLRRGRQAVEFLRHRHAEPQVLLAVGEEKFAAGRAVQQGEVCEGLERLVLGGHEGSQAAVGVPRVQAVAVEVEGSGAVWVGHHGEAEAGDRAVLVRVQPLRAAPHDSLAVEEREGDSGGGRSVGGVPGDDPVAGVLLSGVRGWCAHGENRRGQAAGRPKVAQCTVPAAGERAIHELDSREAGVPRARCAGHRVLMARCSLGSFLAGDRGLGHRALRAGSWPQSPPAHLLSQSVKSASYLVPMVSRSRLWAASYSPAR